jgi:hypothetical protein
VLTRWEAVDRSGARRPDGARGKERLMWLREEEDDWDDDDEFDDEDEDDEDEDDDDEWDVDE